MRKIGLTLLVLISIFLLCCSWVERDRCWISEVKYAEAKKIYEETSSLGEVREQLKEADWRPGEVNQAIYRLNKEYHLEDASP